MKFKKAFIAPFICTAILCTAMTGCGEGKPDYSNLELEKNYGWSHGTINISDEGTKSLSVDEIVPQKSEIVTNLENGGYTVTEHSTALNSGIEAERIYAEKGDLYIDICYGLTDEEAAEIFENYEAEYNENEFYLMARNGNYVYAVSDENTFKTAGFDTLETTGILYIWK